MKIIILVLLLAGCGHDCGHANDPCPGMKPVTIGGTMVVGCQ